MKYIIWPPGGDKSQDIGVCVCGSMRQYKKLIQNTSKQFF